MMDGRANRQTDRQATNLHTKGHKFHAGDARPIFGFGEAAATRTYSLHHPTDTEGRQSRNTGKPDRFGSRGNLSGRDNAHGQRTDGPPPPPPSICSAKRAGRKLEAGNLQLLLLQEAEAEAEAGRSSPLPGSRAGGRSRLPCCWRCRLLRASAERGRETWKKKQLYRLQQRQSVRQAHRPRLAQTNDRMAREHAEFSCNYVKCSNFQQ